MSDDRRKVYSKKGTGTVPKIKCRNNTSHLNQDDHNVVSNNLSRDGNQPNLSRLFRNFRTDTPPPPHYVFVMEPLPDEQNSVSGQNGLSYTTNGSASTPNTSASISRRNSLGTVSKCDNLTKYPDKKQIEDKLNQIRDYLSITSSLMSNIKNTDDQLYSQPEKEHLEKSHNDLKDSELKLLSMLSDIDDYESLLEENDLKSTENEVEGMFGPPRSPKNVLEKKVEYANRQLEMLHEQENVLLNLQLKAENQLREARHAQQKLLVHQNSNPNQLCSMDEINLEQSSSHLNDTVSNLSVKNFNENREIINELDERLKVLKTDLPSSSRLSPASNVQEQFLLQVEALQQKINQLRDSNDNRNQLIHILDKRDAHLQTEHTELQGKLLELQNKKLQVDQLVSQLQNLNEESEEDDVGSQVRKIVTMKQQLSKLKDMLEVVKDTEDVLESQNVNESDVEIQDNAHALSAKTDNLIQNDVRSNRLVRSENVNSRIENNPGQSSNERRVKEKQVNKKSMNANERERLKLQAELQSKKRELEELMCKHKAASSNLNQDVHCENKSDVGATSNSLYEGTTNSWYPMPSNLYHLPNSSERYSSDDCPEDDMNDYSELNSSGEASNIHLIQPMPALSYPTSNYTKHKEGESHLEMPTDTYTRGSTHTPEHNIQSTSASLTGLQRERDRSNNTHDTQKHQIQKQLELIRSVCDSMLEHSSINQCSNAQNLRNNLTPSPLYSEPRQFCSPNPNSMNTVNIVNPPADSTWLPQAFNQQTVPLSEPSNYQNWLATNTLQTQAFMLNTLNQCCQMLWLQQRELSNLRHTVSSLQERVQNTPIEQNNAMCYMNTNPCIYPTVPPPNHDTRSSSHIRMSNNPKMNQASSTASLPNLNQPHVSQTNIEPAYANQNNVHNARVLESGLNNTIHNHHSTVGDHINNTVLHSVNQSLPSQTWNGPALNNQVAPGNRANNYWDNFRSYSRQNLLSTKSNEGLQNQSMPTDRPNNVSERCHTFPFPSLTTQKQNTEQHDSSNSSVENTPRRRMLFKSPSHSVNTDNVLTDNLSTVPPDVLNLNDGQNPVHKTNENNDLLEMTMPVLNQSAYNSGEVNVQPFVNMFMHSDSSTQRSNITVAPTCKDCPSSNQRNRNEWHDDSQNDCTVPKSKLFDELRENVYKEVASLISANQGRPHFLIQLFRDLQHISSDPMRRRTLQSIQSLISHSLGNGGNSQGTIRQTPNAQSVTVENDVLANCPSYFEIPPNIWVHHRPANIENENTLEPPDCQEHLSEVLNFLNTHCDDILQQNLLDSLKELLVESTFSMLFTNTNTKDGIIQKHFASIVMEALDQYRGKRVRDVRINILQTIEDLLRGEISLIRLMRENVTESYEMNSLINNESNDSQTNQPNVAFDLQVQLVNSGCTDDLNNPPQIQNGDLAEADQSRLGLDDDEEEGAVGGVLNILADCTNSTVQINHDEMDLPKIEFPTSAESDVEFTEQGLDQVPTRLTTYSRTHSNIPKDRSNSTRTDISEQF